MKIFVAGGAGYIGSHMCVELLNEGYEVVVADNLSNSKISVIDNITKITGKSVEFYNIDLKNYCSIDKIFKENNIDAVINFAGLKSVGESVENPLNYYENNIFCVINLLKVMEKYNVKKFIFSSSATVYGESEKVPIKEDFPLSAINPYGYTKLMTERILEDLYNSNKDWSIVVLRYFNPVGADKSGLIGEDPNNTPTNLMPYVAGVASGKYEYVKIFGNDYNTQDGTGIRDYIHVTDLAKGHIKSLKKVFEGNGFFIYNLGTGRGYSVLDVIKTFEKVSRRNIPYKFVERRQGDSAVCYADVSKAKRELNWEAKKDIFDMCKDMWNFICKKSD